MPKKCIKFIPEYLIPSLDNKTFGERLKWIDKSAKMLEIDWSHKAGPHWSEQEAQVFVEWDKHKGHFNPKNKLYYSQSKQRFRALLYKLTKEGQLKELPSETKFKKVFCIGQKKNRKKKRDMDAEYESCNEEETSELEYEEPGSLICRKISEDEAVNVLEDHSYSVSDNFPDYFLSLKYLSQTLGEFSASGETYFSGYQTPKTCFLLYNAENEQDILSSDTWVPTSSSESFPDNCQKRVLVERNCENIAVLVPMTMPNLYTEGYYSTFEDIRPENSTLSLPAGKLPKDCYLPANQSTSIPENMPVEQQYLESFESWLRFYQNYEENQ